MSVPVGADACDAAVNGAYHACAGVAAQVGRSTYVLSSGARRRRRVRPLSCPDDCRIHGSGRIDRRCLAVKSFACGTLGLERPDQPQQDRNAFYTVGRWVAVGCTVGGMISLLV
ncbi:hypothetical protein bAD24_III03370 [Burkholderia sp. AD24]|nr:hypothetical protein bAD24_III03370 [Burkholderia sp. AD24]